MTERPKISLVTPSFNQETLIGSAISSVIDQAYENLDYVVIDGGSTDSSADVIRGFEDRLSFWVSEPDDGHYPAVNKGFSYTDGEIMGYLNGDDVLLPGSLDLIASIFETFPEVEWLTGAYVSIDESGRPVGVTMPSRWSRWHLITSAAGRALPQESTFWRRSLWERSGGALDEDFPLAADFELWARFSRYASPTTIRAPLACFRHVAGQRSISQADQYADEVRRIRERECSLSDNDRRSAASAARLIALSKKAGFDKARPVIDSLMGAPEELVFDPATSTFYRRVHKGRGARMVFRALSTVWGRRFTR